jgi:hypothetical protein
MARLEACTAATLQTGALVCSATVLHLSTNLAGVYTCHNNACSFGVFTTHMHYTMRFVYITTALLVLFNAFSSMQLIVTAASSSRARRLVSGGRLTQLLLSISHLFAATLAALVCGALFSSDFIMLTKAEPPGGRDLQLLKVFGINLFVFQFLTHCAVTF